MDYWQTFALFSGLLALWSGFIIGTLKWMLDKSDRHMGERLALLSLSIDTYRDSVTGVQLQLAAFKLETAEKYVPREDWIRFGVMIEAKLDRLGGKLDASKR
jgi:hypothetical protein